MEGSAGLLLATCTITACPAGCAHSLGEASSWCCLESSRLEIHRMLMLTVAVGGLALSSTASLP